MANFKPTKLAYRLFEPSSGTNECLSPVIFLHGITETKENWSDIPQVIADRTKRKAYTVDAANHGDSEHTDVFNFDQNADDLLHFMDEMNIPKAVLVGHSMGGITAVKAALKNPERVEMMFSEEMYVKKCPKEVVAAVCQYINVWVACVKSVPKELNLREAVAHVMAFLNNIVQEDNPCSSEKKGVRYMNNIRRTTEGGYDVKFNAVALLEGFKDYDTVASEPRGQFNGPSYFIYGSLSSFNVGKEEEHIKKHFPQAELIEFEGSYHNVHMEFPEKFAETVVQRLQR